MLIILTLSFVLIFLELGEKKTGILPIENPRYFPDYSEDSDNSILFYQLRPGFSGLYDGYTVRLPVTNITINSDGFRDKEYPIEKPDKTFRIITLGDSFMFGLGVELEDSYPKQLEAMLNKNSPIKYEVLNFGVPGYNTKQEVEMLNEKGLKYSHDAVIIGYLGNDIEDSQLFQKIRLKLMDEYKNKNMSEMEIPYKELDKRINSEVMAYYNNITFDKAWQ